MKLLAAILVFMITAQPVQAGGCDMGAPGESTQHAEMQHDMQGDGHPGHDCCAPADEDGSRDCDNMVQCGTCATAVAVVSALPTIGAVPELGFRSHLNDSGLAPRHASPPYRPPIFIS